MAGIHERMANVETHEGTVSGSKTITFGLRSAKLIINNDSSTEDLEVTLSNEQKMTIRGLETVTIPFRIGSLTIQGTEVPYRIWSFA